MELPLAGSNEKRLLGGEDFLCLRTEGSAEKRRERVREENEPPEVRVIIIYAFIMTNRDLGLEHIVSLKRERELVIQGIK